MLTMTSSASYTGEVKVGGPPAVREVPGLRITKLAVGPMENNAYFLRCANTGDTLLIDAAAEHDRLLETRDDGLLITIVTTHQHPDHWQALGAVAGANGSNTAAHPLDAAPLPVPPDFLIEHGATLEVGDSTLEIIHLRGHTPGSVAVLYRDPAGHPHLFTGDSLFPGGVGKTSSPENFTSLLDDVSSRLFDALPDNTWFYPGHGDDSTLGEQKPHIDEWRERGW